MRGFFHPLIIRLAQSCETWRKHEPPVSLCLELCSFFICIFVCVCFVVASSKSARIDRQVDRRLLLSNLHLDECGLPGWVFAKSEDSAQG